METPITPLETAIADARAGKAPVVDMLRLFARSDVLIPSNTLVHPDGHRVSWLGAPTRSVITARDVSSTSAEGLALNNPQAGEYVIEIVRSGGTGRGIGEVLVTAAGTTRRVPFTIDGTRVSIAIANISLRQVLVPL